MRESDRSKKDVNWNRLCSSEHRNIRLRTQKKNTKAFQKWFKKKIETTPAMSHQRQQANKWWSIIIGALETWEKNKNQYKVYWWHGFTSSIWFTFEKNSTVHFTGNHRTFRYRVINQKERGLHGTSLSCEYATDPRDPREILDRNLPQQMYSTCFFQQCLSSKHFYNVYQHHAHTGSGDCAGPAGQKQDQVTTQHSPPTHRRNTQMSVAKT